MINFRLIFFLFFSLVFSFSFVYQAFAITIFSPVVELETQPGQIQQGVVKVYNETRETIFLEASIEGFAAGEDSGQPVYLPPEEAGEYLDWFTLSQEEITLNPEQVAIIPFEINVPADAVPGGYYAVIFWESVVPDASENQVAIGSRAGTLIFVKIQGDLAEIGSIENFQIKPNNVLYDLPVIFSFDFVNSGNIHLIPEGSVEITNLFGSKKILPINQAKRYVLPDSKRIIETAWGNSDNGKFIADFFDKLSFEINNLTWGKQTAVLNINYGSQGQVISQTVTFWVWPVRSIFLGIILTIIIIFFIKINLRVKKLKKSLIENEQEAKKQ